MISKTYYRYIWLLNLFLDGEAFTYEEIADLWKKDPNNGGVGLPLRTFHEHRKGIKEMFGVDIVCDKSIGYAYFVRNYKVLDFDKPRKWLLNQYNIPKDFLVDYKMRDRILLEKMAKGHEWANTVIRAMRENEELEIDYQKFEGSLETFHVQPYALKVYNRRWYLLGYVKEKGELRTLGLDRMNNVQITTTHFKMPDNFDAQKYYANTVGVYVNEESPITEVKIRAYGVQVDYLRSSPLHKSQSETRTKYREFSEFTYRVSITPELISLLLAMGDRVEVLEPVEFREEMKERIKNMFNLY
jgi:hypothetical protein